MAGMQEHTQELASNPPSAHTQEEPAVNLQKKVAVVDPALFLSDAQDLKIQVRLQLEEKAVSGCTQKFSPQGFRMISETALPAGTPLALQCAFGEVCYLNLSGQVVFCQTSEEKFPSPQQFSLGIKFSAVREWERKILESAIQELTQTTALQEKSLLNILVSEDSLAVEALRLDSGQVSPSPLEGEPVLSLAEGGMGEGASGISIRTPFMARVARYHRIKELKTQGLYLWERPLQSACGPRVKVNGREMIMLASNNYLGLATHPRVKEAARLALEKFGVGAGGARLLSGTFELHEEFEAKLANFKGGEACLVTNSGYSTNLGTLSGLLGKTDTVILDRKDHASIYDGANFSKCRVRAFQHNDMQHLEKILETCGKNTSTLIVVESMYSMDGDIAYLDSIYDLAKKYNAVLMIDDAHATGVLGKTGRGAAEHFGLQGKIDIVMGTLSKGLGGIGGFIVGSKDLMDYLKLNARPFTFTAAIPPMICAAMLAAIEVIETEPQWLAQLWHNTWFMRKGLQDLGYNTGTSETPIIPVIVGEEIRTRQMAKRLEEVGVLASLVTPPAVDPQSCRIRVSIMATHTMGDLLAALSAFERAGQELGVI